MAFKKTLAQRLFRIMRTDGWITTPSSSVPTQISKYEASGSGSSTGVKEQADAGKFRRLFHKRAAPYPLPEVRPMEMGLNLINDHRYLDIATDHTRVDNMASPLSPRPGMVGQFTVEDARKLKKVAQMEMVKFKLEDMGNCISYPELIRVCREVCCDSDQARTVAKALDEAGSVLVLGKAVFLHPDKVVKAIAGLIPFPATLPNDTRRKELEELEKKKRAIDKDADALVRRELWGGLGFLVLQTVGFMRLTFWELSWDVMEPICFYVTSMYFMAGYGFFLRTSTEPSFEGFYRSRFLTKQRKLIMCRQFDERRYNELQKLFNGNSSSSEFRGSSETLTKC